MVVRVHRDCDSRLRLRKVVVEIFDDNGVLLVRSRMFGGLFLYKRLCRRLAHMSKTASLMQAVMEMGF